MKQVILSLLLTVTMGLAETESPPEESIKVDGQVRTRSMLSKTTIDGSDVPLFHEIRSRLGATAKPANNVAVRVEVQDSRNMGSEPAVGDTVHHTTTIGKTGKVDLHQAYFQAGMGPVSLKAGRQKVKLGSQRFISSLEWHPNARVFDGVTGVYTMGEKASLTGLAFAVRDTNVKSLENYLSLYGLHYQSALAPVAKVEFYYFHDISGSDLGNYQLYNIGARVHGDAGPLFYEEEFQWQDGRKGGDKAAFYNATRLGVKVPKVIKVALGFDMMSGSDDGTMENTYVANYYFAHAYFGWLDYFITNPATGVMDFRLDIDLPLHEKVLVKSQNHYFMQAAPLDGADDPYGMEFDLEIHGKFFAKSKIVLGGGLLVPDKGVTAINAKLTDDEVAFKIYLMPIFNF